MKVDAFAIVPHSKNKGTEVELEIMPIVLCKDCVHYGETQMGKPRKENRRYVCDDFNPDGDWFCADGRKKE